MKRAGLLVGSPAFFISYVYHTRKGSLLTGGFFCCIMEDFRRNNSCSIIHKYEQMH